MKKNGLLSFLRAFGTVLAVLFAFIIFATPKDIQAAGTDVRLNVSETSIAKDDVFRLRAYNVPFNARLIFRSSDTSIAYVDNRGYISGISCGDCVVTVTVVSGGSASQTLKCNVTVGPAAISVKFTKAEIVLRIGMKKMLKTIISPLNTVEKPVFYSSEKLVATVTPVGRVKAKSEGEAVIYAFLMNGESAECQIYVLSESDYAEYIEKGDLEGIIEGYTDEDEDGKDDQSENSDKEQNSAD